MTAGGPRPIWCHGASAGDMRALDPLVRALAADHPVVLSAWTRTGREMARRLHPGVPVVHPPIDVPPAPRLALRARRPRLLVLEYLELWPAWIAACRAAGVPVAVVDGRVTGKSLRARMVLRRAAGRLSLFCAQTEGDAERAVALGVRPEVVRVHGNGKHDGVPVAPPRPDDALRAAVGDVDVVVGSLHPDEEGDALTALAACGLRALVAPRYPQRTPAILRAAARLGVDARARSGSPRPARWVVLDTVGELAAAYALGRVAIVGGTFGEREGQNLVEPAAHGLPVVHGPRVANVAVEAAALAGHGAFEVSGWGEATRRAAELLGTRIDATEALARLRGATERHLDALRGLLT